jgi:ribosome recycling factor
MDEYLVAMDDDIEKAMDGLRKDLGKVRTGRASPKLIDSLSVFVASYGSAMPLQELGSIKAADARMLVVTPWDKATITDIEKAIIAAGLGLNPSNDGKIVRVPVPQLSQERRQELVKLVRKMGEDAKVRMRLVRREYNETFKTGEKDGEITEDDCRRLLAEVQRRTDDAVTAVDRVIAAKEVDLLEV